MELLPPLGWSDVARQSDLVAVRGEMAQIRGEIGLVRGEIAETGKHESDYSGRIGFARQLRAGKSWARVSSPDLAGDNRKALLPGPF